MMHPRFPLLAAALVAALALLPAGAARAACDLPLPSGADTPALPRVALALGQATPRLDVLVLGSATVLGSHGTLRGSFAEAMGEALHTTMPKLAVTFDLHGARGQTATAMLEVLRTQLARSHPQLVLWQTGTVEAVRRLPAADFAATLRQGVALAHAADADVVIVDPQFSQMLEARADLPPYRAAILSISGAAGTAVLDRYNLMRGWVEAGQLDPDQTPRAARGEVVRRLHACLGAMLARRLLAGAQAATR